MKKRRFTTSIYEGYIFQLIASEIQEAFEPVSEKTLKAWLVKSAKG